MNLRSFLLILLFAPTWIFAQTLTKIETYLKIDAAGNDPLYTAYAASVQRKSAESNTEYTMNYYTDSTLITYSDNRNCSLFAFWKIDEYVLGKIADFYKKPVVTYSFPDMAIMEYQPVMGLKVKETFLVYSSSLCLVDMEVRNTDTKAHEVSIFPVLYFGHDSAQFTGKIDDHPGILVNYSYGVKGPETKETDGNARPGRFTDFLAGSPKVASVQAFSCKPSEFRKYLTYSSPRERESDSLALSRTDHGNFLTMQLHKLVRPNEFVSFRYARSSAGACKDTASLVKSAEDLRSTFLKTYYEDNLMMFVNFPKVKFPDPRTKMVYISALNMARNSIFPAQGKLYYNFIDTEGRSAIEAEQPGKDAYEMLGLLGYSYLETKSAENSFRNYINYLDQHGQVYISGKNSFDPDHPVATSSKTLPSFNWVGLELYKESRNRQFLGDVYNSGTRHADCLIEEIRAGNENDLGLNLTLVKEERSLAIMARELSKAAESAEWLRKSLAASQVIENMWDDYTSFYYSQDDTLFSHDKGNSKGPKRINGFLALWAGGATKNHATSMLSSLGDTGQFYRNYGIPDISFREKPSRPPRVDVLLNYMIYDGLKKYGYPEFASQIAARVTSGVSAILSRDHNFREYYDPDTATGGGAVNYFPSCVIAKILVEDNAQ
jgi:hypothetical protein